MKHTLLIIFLGAAGLFAKAQIIINSGDLAEVGDTLPAARDLSPSNFSYGNAGPNKTWDFSYLNPDTLVTNYVVDPSTTTFGSHFSSANQAITANFTDYLYANKSSTAYNIKGFAGDVGGLGLVTYVNFNPTFDQYRFPTQYGGTYSGSYGFTKTIPYNQLPAAIQNQIQQNLPPLTNVSNVRLTFTSNFTDLIDAWGKAITPLGIYDCLRQKRTENTTTVIEAEIVFGVPPFSTTSWQEIDNIPSNTTDYKWLTKETKEPLISLEFDSLRNVTSVKYSLLPPPNSAPVAVNDFDSVTYPNSVILNVLLNDSDPDHNNISFQYTTNPVNGTVTDLGGGSVIYQPNNPLFTGVDSFTYVICDDGSPMLCDTATVYVDVHLPVGLAEKSKGAIEIFPNPAERELNIVIPELKSGTTHLHIYNALGQQTIAVPVVDRHQIKVDLSSLASGLYGLTIVAEDKTVHSSRFIIKRN